MNRGERSQPVVGGALGRGGMITKVRAARLAARSGTDTLIVHGRRDDVIGAVAAGAEIGTWLRADQAPLAARKQWLAGISANHHIAPGKVSQHLLDANR